MILHIFLLFLYTAMSQGSTIDLFPTNTKSNLTKITWAHAVNNISLLENALKTNIMMLEADVSLGKLSTDDNSEIPIMAHPPAKVSDLSLEQFLNNVTEHNGVSGQKKGVKLDFKSIEAFDASIDILKGLYEKMKYPVWLNADILSGPVNASATPVNATQFLTNSKQFNNFTLSVGWTTSYNDSFISETYTDKQITDMIQTLRNMSITQIITFPIRAGLAAGSKTEMQRLFNEFANSTFTIWSSAGDPVNIQNLRSFILNFGVDKVYLDVPEEVSSKLHLESSSNCAGNVGLFSVLLSTAVMVITSKIL